MADGRTTQELHLNTPVFHWRFSSEAFVPANSMGKPRACAMQYHFELSHMKCFGLCSGSMESSLLKPPASYDL